MSSRTCFIVSKMCVKGWRIGLACKPSPYCSGARACAQVQLPIDRSRGRVKASNDLVTTRRATVSQYTTVLVRQRTNKRHCQSLNIEGGNKHCTRQLLCWPCKRSHNQSQGSGLHLRWPGSCRTKCSGKACLVQTPRCHWCPVIACQEEGGSQSRQEVLTCTASFTAAAPS